MDIEAKIKAEKKYSRYGIWLFSILIVLQCCAYIYELIIGKNVEFPYISITWNSIAIFCFRYSYSLGYLFKLLNKIEEREVRKAVYAREKNKLSQKNEHT